uniref:phosphatidylserine decarboxylase n=1 Tax=Acetatifactor sp. TaxID=1872090 RepID=UPI004057190A
MKVYNRRLKKYEETEQYGGKLLEILYYHPLGRILLKVVIHPVFSRIYGWYNGSPFSKRKIAPFVEQYQIPLKDYEKQQYKSFNDFFTRKIKKDKRPVDMTATSFVAPADSKLSVYPVEKDNRITVKGVDYTLAELTGGKVELGDYEGGLCLVFRLTMDDYHRYVFVDDGSVEKCFPIKGRLHTVSYLSKEHKVYRENTRVVNVLKTRNFDEMLWIEVGALLVGKIVNHEITAFEKGMEKGYFEPGGSTIILLLKKGIVELEEDIVEICSKGIEVKVQMGEKIGSKGEGK